MNKEKMRWILVLVAITIFGLVGWIRQGQSSSRTTWEYMTIHITSSNTVQREELLNNAGAEGWELVTHVSGGDLTLYGYYHFKRAR